MICSDIWHKYHEWYFRIIIIEIWDNFETSRVVFMPNITTNHPITHTNKHNLELSKGLKVHTLDLSIIQ